LKKSDATLTANEDGDLLESFSHGLLPLGDGAVMMMWELLLQSSATATKNFWCQVDVGMCCK
jgi:hypothetical protein